MLYNKYTKELFNNVADAANKQCLDIDFVNMQIRGGVYLHFKRESLKKFVDNGKVELTYQEMIKYGLIEKSKYCLY